MTPRNSAKLIVALLMSAAAPALAQDPGTAAKGGAQAPVQLPAPVAPGTPTAGATPGKLDDRPAQGSNTNYVHGVAEGVAPGAPPYRLGGPPPNAQPVPTEAPPGTAGHS